MRAALSILILTAAVAGCGNGVAPLTGDIYILQSIAGVPLPAPYVNAPDGSKIVADSIALDGNGRGTRRTTYDGPSINSRQFTDLTYVQSGNHVDIYFPCPPNADCIPGPHLSGTITSASLTIDQSTVYSLKPLIYARLYPPD